VGLSSLHGAKIDPAPGISLMHDAWCMG